MDLLIRKETPEDYSDVKVLIEKAFRGLSFSNGSEGRMVERIRKTAYFIPELSLIAIHNNQIVGHILFSPIHIKGEKASFPSLALSPLSVLPEYQKMGIGKALIEEGLIKAKKLNFESVIVMGHSEYYPRFGFHKASDFGILCPLDVPDEYFMALELKPDSLQKVSGMVSYPEEFFE